MSPEELFRASVVYELPGMSSVRVLRNRVYRHVDGRDLLADVYLSSQTPSPVVVFVHGGFPDNLDISPKDSGQYTSWGRLVASSGMTAVTFNHRLRMSASEGIVHLDDAASDLSSLIAWIREHAAELSVDPRRLAVFAVSAGGPLLTAALPEPGLRCLVDYYGFLDVRGLEWFQRTLADGGERSWSMLDSLDQRPFPPILVARAGQDAVPHMKETIDRFVTRALAADAPLTLLNHPTGRHAFDLQDDDSRSREIIASTLRFLSYHLRASEPAR